MTPATKSKLKQAAKPVTIAGAIGALTATVVLLVNHAATMSGHVERIAAAIEQPTPAPAPAKSADAPFVKFPETLSFAPGLIVIPVETNGAEVRYISPSPALQIIPPALLKDSKTLVGYATTGSYPLFAYTALGDVPSEPAYGVVAVGGAGPMTPTPGPVPQPTPVDPGPTPVDPTKPAPATSLIVIAYESEDGNLPPYAVGAVQQLRAAGREVRQIDDDVINGLDAAPAEVKPAVEAARATGLPAIVVIDGGKVIKAVKLPETTEAILEAVK